MLQWFQEWSLADCIWSSCFGWLDSGVSLLRKSSRQQMYIWDVYFWDPDMRHQSQNKRVWKYTEFENWVQNNTNSNKSTCRFVCLVSLFCFPVKITGTFNRQLLLGKTLMKNVYFPWKTSIFYFKEPPVPEIPEGSGQEKGIFKRFFKERWKHSENWSRFLYSTNPRIWLALVGSLRTPHIFSPVFSVAPV